MRAAIDLNDLYNQLKGFRRILYVIDRNQPALLANQSDFIANDLNC